MLRFIDDVQDRTKVAVNKPTVSRPQAVNSELTRGEARILTRTLAAPIWRSAAQRLAASRDNHAT